MNPSLIPPLLPFLVKFELKICQHFFREGEDLILAHSKRQAKKQFGDFLNRSIIAQEFEVVSISFQKL